MLQRVSVSFIEFPMLLKRSWYLNDEYESQWRSMDTSHGVDSYNGLVGGKLRRGCYRNISSVGQLSAQSLLTTVIDVNNAEYISDVRTVDADSQQFRSAD